MSEFFQQPDQIGTENNQQTPAQSDQSFGQPNTPQSKEGMTPSEVVALEKLERFKFGDKEWTPDALNKAIMRQSDYTKKTQAISQIKGYYDNLKPDLEMVKSNPALADKFKEIYPKEFWPYLDFVMAKMERDQEASGGSAQSRAELPKELQERLDRVETYVKEKEVEKYEATLDTTFAKMSQKYPDGDEEVVLAKAQVLLEQNPHAKIDEATWDRLWKQSHDKVNGLIKKRQETMFNQQKEANSKARDMGPGGAIPGSAPTRTRLKDVAEIAIQQLKGR